MKSLNSLSTKWLDAIYRISFLLGIFIMIKQCVAFSLIVLGTLKKGCDIKTIAAGASSKSLPHF